jgi:hypothetical protein
MAALISSGTSSTPVNSQWRRSGQRCQPILGTNRLRRHSTAGRRTLAARAVQTVEQLAEHADFLPFP